MQTRAEIMSEIRTTTDCARLDALWEAYYRAPKPDDLNTPEDLSDLGKRAHEVICAILRRHGLTYTGGCTPFYSPKAWADRGEQYGTRSELVIVYDGGEVRQAIYPDEDSSVYDEVSDALAKIGLYVEWCTGWYAAVYRR